MLLGKDLLRGKLDGAVSIYVIMQSPLPLRSFEHSGTTTFCACPHVFNSLCCVVPRVLGESKFTCINPMQ